MRQNKSQGYYSGAYQVETEKYQREDFSRSCFIFSGQGAAFPGMFKKQYEDFKIIRDKFKKADSLAKKLGLPAISRYILNPEGLEEDTLPIVRNLALFTQEISLCEILISQKIIPKIVTGHSFGEYTALAASGIISFEEAFDIIYHRDFFCPKANAIGFMVAVTAGEQQTKKVLGKIEFYISNTNSPQQTVVSVAPDKIDEVKLLLEKGKISYKVLSNVPQPYHSPYLNGVKDKMEHYINGRQFKFNKPKIPLFSSVIKKLIDKKNFKEEDIKYILINQTIVPVNFISQISDIYNLRCFNFIGLSARDIWTGFVRDILAGKTIKTDLAINLLKAKNEDYLKISGHKNSKLFLLINRTIGKITGYEIDSISWEDRYQEDLGIDSIKKAEILLTVLKESNIDPGDNFNTSDFVSIKDTVEYLENASQAGSRDGKAVVKKDSHFERYVPVWTPKPLKNYGFEPAQKAPSLLIYIKDIQNNQEKLLNEIESFINKSGKGERRNIIFVSDNSKNVILFFKFFRQLIKNIKQDSFNLVLVSTGQSSYYIGGYASFLKSIKKELPGTFFKHIQFDKNENEKTMIVLVEREMIEPICTDVLYKNGKRFVSDLSPAKNKGNIDLNENSVILALGGAKGITFSLVKNISKKYRPTIYLVGKSPYENEIVRNNISELKKLNPKIYYESLDACDIKSLEKVFLKISKKHQKIDLVINGVGIVKIGFLKDKTDAEINDEFNTKVIPASNILNLALKYRPRKIINFSSIISKYGSAGQSIYAAANEIVNGLTSEYNAAQIKHDSFAMTVHWPAWDSVGMTEQLGVAQKLKESGASLLQPSQADRMFSFDLASISQESVYYLDESELLFYGFLLNNLQSYQSLIGKINNPFSLAATKPTFEKTFDLTKDLYLNDHKIKGVSSVPAAVGLSMFLCLTKLFDEEFPILENVVIHNPVLIKKEPLTCRLEAENKDKIYELSLKSGVPHFSGEIKTRQAKKIGSFALKDAKREVLVKSIYSNYYSEDSLYLGPAFQLIDKAFLDKDGNPFLRVDNSKLRLIVNCEPYDKLIQWLDASFQALGAIGLKHNHKIIPVKISRLAVFLPDKISNYLYVIPSIKNFDPSNINGEVIVVDESGEILLTMTGVVLKSINKYDKSGLQVIKYKKDK